MSLIIYTIQLCYLFLSTNKNSGCGAVRLAYTSGGRVVAGSNPVIPTSHSHQRMASSFSNQTPTFKYTRYQYLLLNTFKFNLSFLSLHFKEVCQTNFIISFPLYYYAVYGFHALILWLQQGVQKMKNHPPSKKLVSQILPYFLNAGKYNLNLMSFCNSKT